MLPKALALTSHIKRIVSAKPGESPHVRGDLRCRRASVPFQWERIMTRAIDQDIYPSCSGGGSRHLVGHAGSTPLNDTRLARSQMCSKYEPHFD